MNTLTPMLPWKQVTQIRGPAAGEEGAGMAPDWHASHQGPATGSDQLTGKARGQSGHRFDVLIHCRGPARPGQRNPSVQSRAPRRVMWASGGACVRPVGGLQGRLTHWHTGEEHPSSSPGQPPASPSLTPHDVPESKAKGQGAGGRLPTPHAPSRLHPGRLSSLLACSGTAFLIAGVQGSPGS